MLRRTHGRYETAGMWMPLEERACLPPWHQLPALKTYFINPFSSKQYIVCTRSSINVEDDLHKLAMYLTKSGSEINLAPISDKVSIDEGRSPAPPSEPQDLPIMLVIPLRTVDV